MGPGRLPIAAAALFLLVWGSPLHAAGNISLFLDGAVVERVESARKGYLEISLPAAVRIGSLRIRPVFGTQLLRVETAEKQPSKKAEKELAAIGERREFLLDRQKALEVKEEIFRSSAKSQSAKAPRRSKTNPEPMVSIRQGTDYAISQLESVFREQRKVARELKQLEEKKGELARSGQAGGHVARVWVAPAAGRVSASYIQTDRSWHPRYELRTTSATSGSFAVFPGDLELLRDESATVHLATLESGSAAPSWKFADAGRAVMVSELPLSRKLEAGGLIQLMTVSLTNTTSGVIPAGMIACYADGAYMGQGRLQQMNPGSSTELSCSSEKQN